VQNQKSEIEWRGEVFKKTLVQRATIEAELNFALAPG